MQDIFSAIQNWAKDNKKFSIATVVKTWGSAPRLVGSSMAISNQKEILGSVSGGCVEGAVIKKALPIIDNGQPELLHFGVADEEAWAVGLSCGGKIDVFVESFLTTADDAMEQQIWQALQHCVQHNKGCVLLSRMAGVTSAHALVQADGTVLDNLQKEGLVEAAQRAYQERKNQIIEVEGVSYFAHVFQPKSRMLIVGAAHISVDLVDLANQFGFETVVIDPRGIFSNNTEFHNPPAHIHRDWPAEVLPSYQLDAYTYAVLLTHDPKIDDQALHLLLKSKVAYIGALGSRRTHAKRVTRLTEAGFSESEIARIHGPIGVDINAKRPKEIALSIMGEVIGVRNEFL
ncbi:MAG: XdhC family protein [Bacteroidota bacterium]